MSIAKAAAASTQIHTSLLEKPIQIACFSKEPLFYTVVAQLSVIKLLVLYKAGMLKLRPKALDFGLVN